MEKAGLYLVPSLAVLVVGGVFLGLGASPSAVGARVYGGPTEGVKRLYWRVEVVERERGVVTHASPRNLRVIAELPDGRSSSYGGRLDDWGETAVMLDFGGAPVSGPVKVRVLGEELRRPLADGKVRLTPGVWRQRARSHGGWVHGRSRGTGLAVEVAPASGVLAVPFVAPLWVEVHDGDRPVAGARLGLAPEGLVLRSGRSDWVTDARGRAEVMVEPREHAVAVGVHVEAPDGRMGDFYSALPVVPGALHASLVDHRLRVAAPVPLERAYYAILTRNARGPGGGLLLAADGRGGSVAVVDLPELPSEPWWAAVSTDAELDSAATVGWPLGDSSREPGAWSAPDRLLLDGLVAVEANLGHRRRRLAALAVTYAALSAVLSALLVVRRVRAAERALAAHLTRQDSDGGHAILPGKGRTWSGLAAAVLCLTLGFLLLAVLAALRVG